MNSCEALELIRSLDLGAGDHAVFGSGPLLIREIISEINDIDILARGTAWRRATQAGELVDLPEHGITVVSLYGGKVTIGTSWAIGEVDVDDAIDTADLIEGVPWVRLELVAAYKRIAARPKDLEHLRLLEAWSKPGRTG